MNPRKRRMQIRQKQLRRRKNVSFEQLSPLEKQEALEQGHKAVSYKWGYGNKPIDQDSLDYVEAFHNIKFKQLLGTLRNRFPAEKFLVLDEGAGRSTLKQELMQPEFGGKLDIITTDVRRGVNWPDVQANVIDLKKKFGKNRFHLVVSTLGGATYSPLQEKAFFQLVSVLKPGGIGVVTTNIPKKRLFELAKRFNITIRKAQSFSLVFTKKFSTVKK